MCTKVAFRRARTPFSNPLCLLRLRLASRRGGGRTGKSEVDGLQQNEENRSNLALIDHDQLRHDPLMALVSDQGNRGDSPPMAGKSTLNRLDHDPSWGPTRYHKIDHDPDGPAGPPRGTVGFNYRDG